MARSTRFALACSGLTAAACTVTTSTPQDSHQGVIRTDMTQLADAPALDKTNTILTVSVRGSEYGFISMDALQQVRVNGIVVNDSNGNPLYGAGNHGQGASVLKSLVVMGDAGSKATPTAGSKEVVISYENGYFALGTASAVGTSVGLATGAQNESNTLAIIEKTSVVDKPTFGVSGGDVDGDNNADIGWVAKQTPATGGFSNLKVILGNAGTTNTPNVWSAAGSAPGASTSGTAPKGTNCATSNACVFNPGGMISVYGGTGSDYFQEGTWPTPGEHLYGGGGTDTLDYSSRPASTGVAPNVVAAQVCVTLGDALANDGDCKVNGTSNEKDNIEQNDNPTSPTVWDVLGSAGNDTLVAMPSVPAGNNGTPAEIDFPATLDGRAGNDTLTPYGGAYVMLGGAGNDTFLMGYDGGDTSGGKTAANVLHGAGFISGGAGTDKVDFSLRAYDLVVMMDGSAVSGWVATSGNAATAAASVNAAATEGVLIGCASGASCAAPSDVENVAGGAANDYIDGNPLNNWIRGGQGDDILVGEAGDDWFDESIVVAQVANATDSGTDTINGGLTAGTQSGTDTVDYSSRSSAVFVQLGVASASGAASAGLTPTFTTDSTATCTATSTEQDSISNVANAIGGSAADCIWGDGTLSLGADLAGNGGNDMLWGVPGGFNVLNGGGPNVASVATESNYLNGGVADYFAQTPDYTPAGTGNTCYNVGGAANPTPAEENCQL